MALGNNSGGINIPVISAVQPPELSSSISGLHKENGLTESTELYVRQYGLSTFQIMPAI